MGPGGTPSVEASMSMSRKLAVSLIAPVLIGSLSVCGGDSTSPPAVASVQMTSTNSNPRVGETAHVGATPVNDGGVQVQGVTCTFSSGTPSVATVGATDGTITALAVGTTVITATCGGKSNTI